MKIKIKRKVLKEGSFTDAVNKMVGDNFISSDDFNSQTPVTSDQATQNNTQGEENEDEVPDEPYVAVLAEKGYQVKRVLGSGMFGTVVLATDEKFRDVAIKVLAKVSGFSLVKGPRNFAFKRELRNYQTVQDARKKSKLVAKHFPKVFDIFTEGDYGFIVLELLTDKGVKANLINDIFQGGEGLMAPAGDAVEVGVYKNLKRRMYTYLMNDAARNRIISNLLDGASEKTINRVQQELSSLPFLQLPEFRPGQDDQLYSDIIERLNRAFEWDVFSNDAFFDNFGELKKEFSTNPGLLIFIIKLIEIVKEEQIVYFYQNSISIAMSWINFIRKASPIGVHNRPEARLQDRGGADPEIGDAVGEAASIRKALEELEKLTGLAGRDMHQKNVMIRKSTGDIVIVDLGLFKPRADIVSETKNVLDEKFSKAERKKRAKKCDNPKGFTMKQFCKNQRTRSKKGERKNEAMESKKIKVKITKGLDEKKKRNKGGKCLKGYKTHPTRKTKKMFGRTYRNCVKAEGQLEEGYYSKGKCVYKKDNNKKVGCTDGPVKDYLAALYANVDDAKNEDLDERKKKGDPKKGTGKKPKGSGRRLYTDEDPSDTVSVSFKSVSAIQKTLSKPSFKSKSHKRQSQIINLIHQRARAAYQNAKDPKVKARLKKAYDYAKKRKEASKKKTIRMRKNKK